MSLGVTEIILILIAVLILFGGKKIPELARGLGKAQAEYKKAREAIESEVNEFKTEVEKAAREETQKKTPKKNSPQKKTAAKKTTRKTTAKSKK